MNLTDERGIRAEVLLILALFFFTSCASQRPPSGGPPDKTPPTILKIIPENNATLVPLDQRVEFEFSEGMDRKSLAKAVFITPDPGERVKFKWKGRRLRIQFADSLKTNRSYVITLGTDLKDARGNPLKESYTLAFSTGAELSNGKISGQVFFKEKVQGVLIWAYTLDPGADPNPTARPGDYVTQTDAQGRFQLSNLSEGTYRVLAILDKDNNRFFEVGLDALGVPTKDILLTKDSLTVSDMKFKLAVRDTLRPALVSASAPDQMHVVLRFDEPLRTTGTAVFDNFTIRSKKSSRDSLRVQLAYLNDRDAQEVALATLPQAPKTEYEIAVRNLTDRAGNTVDEKYNLAQFVASALPDTARPKIVATVPKDSARAVLLDSAIELHFSKAMKQPSLAPHFQLRRAGDQTVPGTIRWETPALAKFKPLENLESLSLYSIVVKLDSIFDLAGNQLGKGNRTFTFTTLNADTLSTFSGTVMDEDSTASGAIYLQATSAEPGGQVYERVLEKPGPYTFANILPGTYIIEAFRDRDNNGQYSFGRAVPFQPAERFVVHSENIKVRSRWPNEGNDIMFK